MRTRTSLRLAVCTAAILTAAPAGLAQNTAETDPGFLERIIQSALGGDGRDVQIRGLTGPLSGEPRIAEITVADNEGVWLSIRDVALNWQRLAIFRGRVEVNSLTIGEVDLSRTPVAPTTSLPSPEASEPETDDSEASGPFALPELPVSIRLDQLAVGTVQLGEPIIGQAAELSINGNAQLEGGEGSVVLNLVRLDGTPGRFDLNAGFQNQTRQLNINLDVREDAGGLIATLAKIPGTPSLELQITGDDPISDFAASLALRTDDVDRLSGNVRITESPVPTGDTNAPPLQQQTIDAQIGGDVTELFIPQFKPFFGDSVALDLRATRSPVAGISVETLNLSAAALELNGQIELSNSFAPRLVDLQGVVERPYRLPVVLPLPGPSTLVDSAQFSVAFNADQGDSVIVNADIENLLRDDGILVDRLNFIADGRITLAEGNGVDAATADVSADLTGLSVTDPRFFEAAGDSATLSANVDWEKDGALNLSDLDLVSGQIALTGDVVVNGLESGAPDVAVSAEFRSGPLDRFATLTGTLLTGTLDATVDGEFAAQTGAFDVTLDGTGQDLAIGQPQADGLLAGPVTLGLTAARDGTGIRVDRLDVSSDAVSLTGGGTLASQGGNLTLDGEIADLSALDVETLSGPLTVNLSLDGEDDLWDARFDLVSDTTTASGTGEIQNLLGGSISVTADADVDTGDLSRYAPLVGLPLAGQLTLDASGSFDAASGDASIDATGRGDGLSIGQTQADALLAGTLALDIAAARTGDEISVDQFTLSTASLSATGGGKIEGSGGDLTLQASLPDLTVLQLENIDGPLSFTASLKGTDDKWNADLDLESDEATVVGEAQIAGLFAGEIDANGNARIDTGDLSRFAALVGMPITGQLNLNAEGSFEAATGDATIKANGTGTSLAIGIAEADAMLAGNLDLNIDGARQDGDIVINQAQLRTNQISLNADGEMQEGSGRFDLTLGVADISAVVTGVSGPIDLRAAVEGQDQTWDVAGNLTGPAGMSAVVQGGAVRPDGSVDLSLTGTIPLLIADKFIMPRSIVGDMNFDLTMQGQPGLDALGGTITIANARASDPATRLVLEDINLNVGLSGSSAQIDLTSALSTGGTINVSGPVNLTAPFDADISAALLNLTLLDPTLYEINLNGEASLRGPLLGNAALAAQIGVVRAEIKIPAGLGGPGAVPDIMHVDEPEPSLITRERAGLQVDPDAEEESANGGGPVYDLDVIIAAPQQVFVRGRGLDIEMGGGITIGGTTAAPVPTGGISIRRGQFALLGQRLQFEQAEISLQGNLVPDLDIVAFSDSGTVTAYIEIVGPVTAPELSFRSDPELPEDEVLSQLFFGKPINELTPLEVAQLIGSVNRLTGGGNGILGNLREGLGIDSLGVTTDAEGGTEVTAGKYLSERLFTDVTVGASGTTEIQLNYEFNSTFKGRAAFDSIGDSSLGFAFERDY